MEGPFASVCRSLIFSYLDLLRTILRNLFCKTWNFEDEFLACFRRLDNRTWRSVWWLACRWEVCYKRRAVNFCWLADTAIWVRCDSVTHEFYMLPWKLPGVSDGGWMENLMQACAALKFGGKSCFLNKCFASRFGLNISAYTKAS